MKTELFIATRYLFAKKSHSAINWVSGISVAGVATSTAAMICILSVFNGFRLVVANLFTAFDPELRVELVHGKTVDASDPALVALRTSPAVAVYTEVLEDMALVRWHERQTVAVIKGVTDNFDSLTNISSVLVGNTSFITHAADIDAADDLNFAICGIGIANRLSLPIAFDPPLEVWAPRNGKQINMGNPASSFRRAQLHSAGSLFSVGQSKYDDTYIIANIDFVRMLFGMQGKVSYIELSLAQGYSRSDIEHILQQAQASDRFRVLNRYEQQADSFRIMNIEKLMAYLFFTFIMLIAAFNIVGSLSMLIIEKSSDVQTLRALGAGNTTIRRVFAMEGRLIGLVGAVIGLVVGLLLCWLQSTFGLISLGSGSYIIDNYPVEVQFSDVLIVFATVAVVSWMVVLWPVRNAFRRICHHRNI